MRNGRISLHGAKLQDLFHQDKTQKKEGKILSWLGYIYSNLFPIFMLFYLFFHIQQHNISFQ